MTRIDFYILPDQGAQSRQQFACRLAEKAYALGNRIYVHTESEAQAQRLDELLWTFKQDSFLPHELCAAGREASAPILLGHDPEPLYQADVLINLSSQVPLFFGRFERVAEIVDGRESERQQGRARYGFYRDRGYELKSHSL